MQGETQFRNKVSDINQLYVRSSSGAMVPLQSLVHITTIEGPDTVNAYNLYPAAPMNGAATPGKSSGQAMMGMEQVAKKSLPAGYDWTGRSCQELQATGQEIWDFISAAVFSCSFLVALYESSTLPLSVMLPVAFALLGGLVLLLLRGMALDVYGQIGLVLERRDVTIRQATALAFIIGVIPLVIATGAGASARTSIGTTVFDGMVLASFVGVLFVPALFVSFERTPFGDSRNWHLYRRWTFSKLLQLSLFQSRVGSILKRPVHPLECNKMPFFVAYAHRDSLFHVPCSSQSGCDRSIGFG